MNQTADGWYAAAAPSGNGKRKQAYDNNLKDVFITLDDSTQAMLKQSAQGPVEDDNLNGGYVKTEAAIRFVDTADAKQGIILIGGRIVAVFPDGSFSYVAVTDPNDADKENAQKTISVSPEMKPRLDKDGEPVKDTAGNVVYDVQFRVEGTPRADGTKTYVYSITTSNGLPYEGDVYIETSSTPFSVNNGRVELTNEEAAALVEGAYSKDVSTLSWIEKVMRKALRLQLGVAPQYTYAGNLIVVDPIESTNGALLHFSEGCSEFETRRDKNGLAILNQYTRIVDTYGKENSSIASQIEDLEQGTVIFLNTDGTIAAYLNPDGSFVVYDGSRTQDDKENGERVYAKYSTGTDKKLDVTLSKNSRTRFMEVAAGTGSSKTDDVLTSVYGLHEEGSGLHGGYNYEKAHYFGYSADGTLIELATGARYYDYDEDGKLHKTEDESSAVETGIALANGTETLLTVINNINRNTSGQENRAVFVMYDDATLDSESDISKVTKDEWREYDDLTEDLNINVGILEGGEIILETHTPSSADIHINGLDDENVSIVTDQLVLLTEGAGTTNYGDKDHPMEVIARTDGSATNVIFRQKPVIENGRITGYEGAFNGRAYVDANGDIVFTNSVIKGETEGEQGVVNFNVKNGDVDFIDMKLTENTDFTVTIENDEAGHTISSYKPADNKVGLVLTDNATLTITADKADAYLQDVDTDKNAKLSLTIEECGDIRFPVIDLKDTSAADLTTKDGNVFIETATVANGTDGHASLTITARDDKNDDQQKGNLMLKDLMDVQGTVIIDIDGSFLAHVADTADQKGTTLKIGSDAYKNGSSFTMGGDLGSKEIPMTVDVIQEDGTTVPLNIVSVRDVYITDAEHNETSKPAGEAALTADAADVDKIAQTVADAVQSYRDTAASEDATEEEKAQAQAALDELLEDLKQILTGDALERLNSDPDSITAEELEAMVREAVEAALANAGTDPAAADPVIGLYNKLLTDEERQALFEELQRKAEENKPEASGNLEELKDLTVNIGTVTGSEGINISSNGDVNVTVNDVNNEDNTVRIGTIETSRSDLAPEIDGLGDVMIEVKDGSIAGTGDGTNVTGQNITLKAVTGSITSMIVDESSKSIEVTAQLTNPDNEALTTDNITFKVVDGKLTAVARAEYTEGYAVDENAAGTVNATADKNIEVTEETGDMGIGVIDAENGTVTLATGDKTAEDGKTTRGDLFDARTDEQKAAGKENIKAGAATGTSYITAGGVGVSPDLESGQKQQPIIVDITSSEDGLVVDALTDINLDAKNSLTATTDSRDGKVYADAEKDLTISTTKKSGNGTGDLTIVEPTVGGNLTINSKGKVNAEREDGTVGNLIAPENVTVNAMFDITATDVIAENGNATVKSTYGNITTATVSAADTATICAQHGNIIEGERPEGTPAVKGDSVVLETIGVLGSSDAYYEVDTASGRTGSGTLSVIAGEAFIKEMTGGVEIDTVDITKNTDGETTKTTSGNFTLKADGDVTGGTVNTAGITDITAGGDVGTDSKPLTVNAYETVKVDAEGNTVNLKSDQDMKVDSINSADGTGNVKIDANGNITDANGEGESGSKPAIAAGSVDLTAEGSVGTKVNPLDISADTAKINAKGDVNASNDKDLKAEEITSQNGGVNLDVDGDLTVDKINAKTDVDIKANGDVTGTDAADPEPNITADSLNIDTTGAGDTPGNVSGTGGANGDALTTKVNNLSGNTGNITVDNNNGTNGNLAVGSLTGKDVDITTSGSMTGSDKADPDIVADNLTTTSGGDTKDMTADVTGNVSQTSKNGSVNTKINGAVYTNGSKDDIAKKNAEAAIPTNQIILAKAKASKKNVTLTWTAAKGATGYVIYWNGKIYKKVSASVRKLVISGLKKKKVCNFQVVAVRNGKVLGKSLKSYTGIKLKKALPKKIKAKKKLKIKVKKSKKLKITIKKKGSGALLKKGKKLRFLMDKKGIIKVSKSGKIKALKKGVVTLYTIAVNGVWKKTVVTVK